MAGPLARERISRSYNPSLVPCPMTMMRFLRCPGQPATEKSDTGRYPVSDSSEDGVEPLALGDRLGFRGGALHARRHLAGDGALLLDRGGGGR